MRREIGFLIMGGVGFIHQMEEVFRSADGLKQFRMTNSDLAGKAFIGIPHVHICRSIFSL